MRRRIATLRGRKGGSGCPRRLVTSRNREDMATSKHDISIGDLVKDIQTGKLRLPEMQRRYVWRAARVRDLLDSLYRGYPSGSILIWETDNPQPSRDLDVAQAKNPFGGHKLLLDGQQRLTSLSAILRGEPVVVRGRKRPIEILFNLEHPDNILEFTEVEEDQDDDDAEDAVEEEISVADRIRNRTFVVASRALAQLPNWVSVSDIFTSTGDSQLLRKAGVTSFDDPRIDKYVSRIQKVRAIQNYMYAVNLLSKDIQYEEVAEIFVRVNSLGVKLRGSDLALAQITARWPNSLELFEKFQEECEEYSIDLDIGTLVRALVVFATNQCKFTRVSQLSREKLEEAWEKTKQGLSFAISFLRTRADIADESLLSSPLFFITLAYFSQIRGERLSEQDAKGLLRWLHLANARGRYGRGSSDTLLDNDLRAIHKGGGPDELIEILRQQVGRLELEASDFVGRGINSALFPLVFLVLKQRGATDWETGVGISTSVQGKQHKIQYHHIFPKSKLKEQYDRQLVNEIANMAFIGARTNQRISSKKPTEYLRAIRDGRGEKVLTAQAIPLDEKLYEIETFEAFLTERRQRLADAVNEFLRSLE